MCQQFQGATIDSRLSSQIALDGMVGFTAVSRTSMKYHLPLDGTSLRVPDEHTKTQVVKPRSILTHFNGFSYSIPVSRNSEV